MNEKESKKYFVKDEALHGIDKDKFHYSDISKVLSDIIDTNTPPFNVAVIGKWGLGKSSLINLVIDRCKKQHQKYCVQEINAWKYEKESLRRVFLKQLWQGLNEKKIHSFEVVRKEIIDIVKTELNNKPMNTNLLRLSMLKIPFIITVCSVVLFVVYKAIQFRIVEIPLFTKYFWAMTFLGYCKNIGIVLFVPVIVAMLKSLIDEYRQKQIQKFELNFPIETTDDYEIFLESKIKEHLQNHKDLKIITIIDDLDRLSINKIVEALDALKAFVGFPGCVFVVPFDDEIIKQALNKRRVKELNERDDIVESELILDKLFQFKVYLPPLLDFDIRDYAFSLAKQEIPDFLNDYCDEKLMEKVIRRILIHPSVTTPRQVKKLLNAFVNNYMIACAREQSGKIEKGLLTSEKGTMQIAKISVLQADFNKFYDLLFKDMSCLEKFLSYHRGEVEDECSEYLRPYFMNDSKGVKLELKGEYEPLANFLIKTEKYHVDNIAPYLYLAQDKISIKTGDELQRRVTQALISGNIQTVKALLEKDAGIADVILRNVVNEMENIANTISVAISIFSIIKNESKLELAQGIIDRTLELDVSEQYILYSVPPENIYEIAEMGETAVFNEKFIITYLSVFLTEDRLMKKSFLAALKVSLQKCSKFTQDIRSYLHRIVSFSIDNSSISAYDLLDCVNTRESDVFNYFWGINWFNKLCDYIGEEEDFSSKVITCLGESFKALIETECADQIVAPLVHLSKYEDFLPEFSKLLDVQYAGKSFKEMISHDSATEIAECIIGHDFSDSTSTICSILKGLPYEITEDNCNIFDEFLLRFEREDEIDDILVECGARGVFDRLQKTTEAIISYAFQGEDGDKVVNKLINYFNESMVKKVFDELKQRCGYKANYNYSRELSIIHSIEYSGKYSEKLEQLFNEKIKGQLSSYYKNEEYLEFVLEVSSIIKDDLSKTSIKDYVDILLNNIFMNNQKAALSAIEKISGAITSDIFDDIFHKIVNSSTPTSFDDALKIIIKNDNIRPREEKDQKEYLEFLKKNLRTSINPNRVINTIVTSFPSISDIDKVVAEAVKNQAVSMDVIYDMVAYYLKETNEQEGISSLILEFYKMKDGESIIFHSLERVQINDVSNILSSLLDENIQDIVLPVSRLAAKYLEIPLSKDILLKCLSTSIAQINLVDTTLQIIEVLIDNKSKLNDAGFKEKLIKIIQRGFVESDSVALREKIILLIGTFKIKSAFKKGLNAESLEFYKKYTR